MAYDEGLAQRVREAVVGHPGVDEKEMFGGIAFMLHGNMWCGVAGDDLMLRVGPDRYQLAVAREHARPMDFTGRPMKGMVYVAADGVEADEALADWLELAGEFVRSLPAK